MNNIRICHTEEAEAFYSNHAQLVEASVGLHGTVLQLLKSATPDEADDRVLLRMALSCLKEFEEIFLLCGNGYGTGATKLLRPFYERTITFTYLLR